MQHTEPTKVTPLWQSAAELRLMAARRLQLGDTARGIAYHGLALELEMVARRAGGRDPR